MKNLRLLTVFAFLFIGSFSLSAQEIGVVSIEEIFNALPAKKSADETMDKMVNAHKTEIEKRENALKAIEEAVQTKVGGKSQQEIQGMAAELESMQKDYMGKQQELVTYQQAAAKEVNEKENALMKPIEQTVKNSIDKIAAAKGLKYVLEKGMLIYANGMDITADVKKDLGIQ